MQMNINCMQLHSYKAYISGFSRTLPCLPNTNSLNDDQHFHKDHLNTCYMMLCTLPAYNQDLSCIPRYVTKTNIFLHNLYSHSKKYFPNRILVKLAGQKLRYWDLFCIWLNCEMIQIFIWYSFWRTNRSTLLSLISLCWCKNRETHC